MVSDVQPVKDVPPWNFSPESEITVGQRDDTDGSPLFSTYINRAVRQTIGQHVRNAVLPLGGGNREQKVADLLGLSFLPPLIGFLIAGIVGLGIVRWFWREGACAANTFAVFYFCALFFWNWDDPRLLYPILFQLLFGLLLGGEQLLRWGARILYAPVRAAQLARVGAAVAVLFLALIFTVKSVGLESSRVHVGDISQRSLWLQKHAEPQAIVLSEAPEIDYLYSNRKMVRYPNTSIACGETAELVAYLHNQQIDYILVAPEVKWRDQYVPDYSQRTTCMLPLLDALVAQKVLVPVATSEQHATEVFQVQNANAKCSYCISSH